MRRIDLSNDLNQMPAIDHQYCEYLDFKRNINDKTWPDEFFKIVSYDFPEIYNPNFQYCKIREDGVVIFLTGEELDTAKVAYQLFEEPTSKDSLSLDFSHIKSLTSCRNNPLHYHIISLEKSDGNILQFKKKYKFVDNDKYYFEADFDGTTTEFVADNIDDNTSSNFYFDNTQDSRLYTSLFFKDPTTTVRLKCSSNIASYKINNVEKGPNDMVSFSPDYLNGFTISEIRVDANSPATAVLEVWT